MSARRVSQTPGNCLTHSRKLANAGDRAGLPAMQQCSPIDAAPGPPPRRGSRTPTGMFTGYACSPNTRELLVEEGGFLGRRPVVRMSDSTIACNR